MASPAKKRLMTFNDEHWSTLYGRAIENDPGLQDILSPSLFEFTRNFASSRMTTDGMILPTVLTTINFVLAANEVRVQTNANFKQNLNTYFLVVGQPFTGKIPAVTCAAREPIAELAYSKNIFSDTTYAGLTQHLSDDGRFYLVNSEISGYFNRIFDTRSTSNDVELLCDLYSGAMKNHGFAQIQSRIIKPHAPFCILGK